MTRSIFRDARPLSPDDQRLVELYSHCGRSVDDLPYTEEFEGLWEELRRQGDARDRGEVFRRLVNLRKAARLQRVGRSTLTPVKVAPEAEQTMLGLVEGTLRGSVGGRDRLPYTKEFEDIVDTLNSRTGLKLSYHDAWRLLATLAKSPML